MADLSACNRNVVITFFSLFFALVFTLAALGSPMWSMTTTTHYGLFQSCGYRPVLCYFYTWDAIPNWLLGVQGMMALGTLCILVPFCLIPTYYCKACDKSFPMEQREVTKWNMIASFVAAFFILIALVVYPIMLSSEGHTKRGVHIGASYYVAWIGGILCVVHGVWSLLLYRRNVDVTDWLKD